MTMAQGRSEPFYFGPEDEQLFGCLHVAAAAEPHESGIVIVPPMDQEYLRSHRALRQLAARLAGAGFPSLRFDLYACGDSAGECERGSVSRWVGDVGSARAEIAARTGGVCGAVVGLRLGALLAARSALRDGSPPALVLWDPVVSGRRFLAGLRRAHEAMVKNLQSKPKQSWEREAPLDLLGFPFPDSLIEEIEGLDLAALERAPAERVLVVSSGEDADTDRLVERLRELGAAVRLERVDGPRLWEEDASKALVPHRALEAIVRWIREELP